MNDDATLLRRFTEEKSEAAFTELVQRHLNLVYGAALRRTGGDGHRAADVAQQVFTALACQAPTLVRHAVLGAWLHTATRNIAVNLMISEQRRKFREETAVTLAPPGGSEPPPDWDKVRPVLDAAIDELPESDRVAVVLRFLDRRPFAEIGTLLDVSADAARMRTERALEKLRAGLARRGITSTATALGALVSTHSGVTAPTGLAAIVAPAALGGMATTAGVWGAAGIFFVSTKTIVSIASVVAALGLGLYLGLDHSAREPLAPSPAMPPAKDLAALRQENLKLKAEVDRLNVADTKLAEPPRPAPLPRATPAVVAPKVPVPAVTVINQQRAMINNLRMIAAAVDQFQLQHHRAPASLDEIVGPTKYIKQLNQVDGESYAGVLLQPKLPMSVVTPNGVAVTYDPAGNLTTDTSTAMREAQLEVQRVVVERFGAEFVDRVGAAAQKAGAAYAAAHNGKSPPTPEAALSYFETPEAAADFLEIAEVMKAMGVKK